ncbi:prephenate dehydrogenase [Streptomyces sp. NBC_00184]|uniref:prephenate dehydrogenase n=1 Tax=Streptomyces sp. NBC_00184 TaxID=2975673 RepID=UPI002E286BE6|nr:prephenate dehydrogenase [Streptomyces sp. NBC_00184]
MRTAVIAGTGLIGTSIALALRERGITTYLTDADPAALQTAEALGAGRAEEPREVADIAILAVPPVQVAPVLAMLQKRGTARFYTDVASVKGLPSKRIEALGCDLTSVVGGHPLAGGERSGPLAARADLFEGRPWVLVPSAVTSDSALNCALELTALCGATPVLFGAEDHDRAVALVSHAPHLIASLAAARLLDGNESALRLAGQGLRDVTRIAGGSPALWTDILSANAGPVADVLEAFAGDVLEAVAALRRSAEGRGGGPELSEALQRGVDGRARIPGKHGVPDAAFTAVEVSVGDSPGELARLFTDVAAAGSNIEDIGIDHSAKQLLGRASLAVAAGTEHALAQELRHRGWAAQSSNWPSGQGE